MTFYAIELDTCPAYGWEGGPNTDILIHTLRNKHERRNWIDGVILHTFTLPFQNVNDASHLEDVKTMFMVMHGPHHSFLCKDYSDFRHGFKSDNFAPMQFGVGDAVESVFQLSKTYEKGVASFARPITKPVEAGLKIYVQTGGVGPLVEVFPDVNPLTGEVDFDTSFFFAIPGTGDLLFWEGEFRVPVRFSSFYLPSTIDGRHGEDFALNGSCTLQEVVGE